MTLKVNTAEGQAHNTVVTAGNTGGGSGDIFGVVAKGPTPPTFRFSTTQAIQGVTSYEVIVPVATDNVIFGHTGFTGSQVAGHFFLFLTGYPGTSTIELVQIRTSTNVVLAKITLTAGGKFQLQDSAGAFPNQATQNTWPVIPLNTWVRVEFQLGIGASTSTGTLAIQVHTGNSATVDYSTSSSTANTGVTPTNAVDNVRWGKLNTAGTLASAFFDHLAAADGTVTPLGPYVTPGAAPSVNAGPDLTKETGSSNFTITATATASGAATIASHSWTQISGTAVTLSGQSTATVTVTPPAGTTTVVLRYTATDSLGVSSSDDVTITFVPPGQSFRPVADILTTSWAAVPVGAFYGNVDEVTPDTADYAQSANNPTGQELKVRLEAKPGPATTTGIIIEVMLSVTAVPATQSVVVKLYDSDGTTVRKTATITTVTTTPTVFQITLTSPEAAAITGWTSGLVLGIAPTLT